MAAALETPQDLVARVGELIEALDGVAETPAGALAQDLIAALLELHRGGLERVLELAGDGAAALADDPVVASLLLIHDLHPVPLEVRVQAALESVRPYMESHGGDVELLGVEDGVVRLRLSGSCKSCRASSSTLELAVQRAIEEHAPDIEGMEVEGLEEPTNDPPPGAMLLPMAAEPPAPEPAFALPVVQSRAEPPATALRPVPGMAGHGFGVPMDIAGLQPPPGWRSPLEGAPGAPIPGPVPAGDRTVGAPDGPMPRTALRDPGGATTWTELPAAATPSPGTVAGARLEGATVVVANVAGTLLAFADVCAGCGAALSGGTLTGGFLPCPSCERTYALPRAGRCMDEPDLQLEPFPILREGSGPPRVAVPAR